jgi:hypothetical protein
MVCVYQPCKGIERDNFVSSLYNLDIPLSENWLLLGDFNFIRSQDNRNNLGDDMNDIFLFKEIISHLGLLELPLKGRAFTWSNMQKEPLLEQLDWFFTSCEWTIFFQTQWFFPLAKTTSDYTPCGVKIATKIPKSMIFRFENFWIKQLGFYPLVEKVWQQQVVAKSSTARISTKFKFLIYELKKWGKGLSHIKTLIGHCNSVILFFDQLEDSRLLSIPKFKFRIIVKNHMKNLMGI